MLSSDNEEDLTASLTMIVSYDCDAAHEATSYDCEYSQLIADEQHNLYRKVSSYSHIADNGESFQKFHAAKTSCGWTACVDNR